MRWSAVAAVLLVVAVVSLALNVYQYSFPKSLTVTKTSTQTTTETTIEITTVLVTSSSIATVTATNNTSEEGFGIYSLKDNSLLISNADILSYNWTSQEMAISPQASERLNQTADLYSWTGFVIRIDGEEIYRGVFRENTMNAIPAPPEISIIFPSVIYPSGSENYGAIRMFFPSFQPPSDQPVNNAKILHYFEITNRLEY